KRAAEMIAGARVDHARESAQDQIACLKRNVFCNFDLRCGFFSTVSETPVGQGGMKDEARFGARAECSFHAAIKLRKNAIVFRAGPEPAAHLGRVADP